MTDQVTQFEQMLSNSNAQQQQQAPDQAPKTPEQGGEYRDFLSSITNEKGEPKYNSVEAALQALKASQEHISTLETENSKLRERTTEAATVEQILAQLDSTNNKTDDNQNSVSMEDIKSLVSQTLEEKEQARTALGNINAVKQGLSSVYGEKATEQYQAKAAELGLTPEMLDHLSAISPKAVLAYFDSPKGPANTSKTIHSSVNTEAFQAHNTPQQPPKGVMYGASSQDILKSWKYASEQFNQ